MASLAEMEKRLVMAESMLEATLQYQSGQMKVQTSPRYTVGLRDMKFLLLVLFSVSVGGGITYICPSKTTTSLATIHVSLQFFRI